MTKRIQAAIEALKKGEMVILIDSEDRENEGDLVLAAQFATPDKINFFIRQACGLVCLCLEAEQVDRLGIPQMVSDNKSLRKTAFTISIEASSGISTGISAADRARTVLVASDPDSTPHDIASPGHIFPLRAVKGGVLERAGHTEGSIELCKIAGLRPAAVICEIINEDGSMARKPDLESFSKKHKIPMVTIEELIAYQAIQTDWIAESNSAKFPNRHEVNGSLQWKIRSHRNRFSGTEHAFVYTENLESYTRHTPEKPTRADSEIPLVRLHSECLTGDCLGSLRCDCGFQLELAMDMISKAPEGGAVVYLKNHEGRGIGLWNKVQAYALQDQGMDTIDANLSLGFAADTRIYTEAAKILHLRGLTKIRLLTNNPTKVQTLKDLGIDVIERVPLQTKTLPENQAYLRTKQKRFQHHLENL
jgi:3,4-dihydroxy 2-butanone 4-phosphate synthase/GTP cyclohydrolase II